MPLWASHTPRQWHTTYNSTLFTFVCVCVSPYKRRVCALASDRKTLFRSLSLFLAFFGCNSNPADTHIIIIIHTRFGSRLGQQCEARRCQLPPARPPPNLAHLAPTFEPSHRSPTPIPPSTSPVPRCHSSPSPPPIRQTVLSPFFIVRPLLQAAPFSASQPHNTRPSIVFLFSPLSTRLLFIRFFACATL